ncbi:midasin [Melanomma pulvis-pyrius CBS 109.77]|uniref:Midasin n=1 Tax=Melanomma pulvis-pyrius CBS 109.77 TaxID=1314802 RepID=A0A6A6XFF7_9PLEO|nr:midasin [Melanomma pulvis-pyrius CBS 109.77]
MEARNPFPAGKTITFEALASVALNPIYTDDLFVQYEGLFVEVCAHWISSGTNSGAKIAAFGRMIPLAPYIAEHLERFLTYVSQSPLFGRQASDSSTELVLKTVESDLCQILLGIFRLLSLDFRNFAKHVRPLALESLFQHPSRAVRYLAVRVFCLYVHAADYATLEMVKRHVGEGEIQGDWEGQILDYRFLPLWEEKRWSTLQSRLEKKTKETSKLNPAKLYQQLSPYTIHVNGILLPRLDGAPSQEKPSQLISTSTTESNLSKMATGLLGSSPLLLTGLAGSGKTLLTRQFAWQLNKLDSMVTLHLNEQSDAKLLVGMYATGATPGTFSWRPGVLTTAVKEGRWIFVEDLDRAPNEVISTLLPLIERGELLIPSRGETITAARGFRIIATMRSTVNPRGHEIVPRQNMMGHRFWNSIKIQMPQLSEFEQIVTAKYPALRRHVPGIMRVYSRLLELFSDAKFSSENGTSLRALTPRDLLKWCDRIVVLLAQSSSFNTAQMDDIFMEAKDCFAGSLRSDEIRLKVMACVAEELHIDPQRRDHLLMNREVKLEVPNKSSASGTIRIGRARLSKHKSSRKFASGRPFSTNDYTLRLLEKVAVAANQQEPLLLVGETGTGKTTCIQYLAEQLGRKLVAFNLSQQSESGDLLGGYKPVNVRSLVIPLKDEFDELFDTLFSRKNNRIFLDRVGKRVAKGEWKRVCLLWREALKTVDAARKSHESQTSSPDPGEGQPKKKRKVDTFPQNFDKARWEKFAVDLGDLEAQLASGSEAFAFSFLEGNIVKAVRNGDWVLLDEINLASSDTLEALADLLGGGPDGTPSILLTETGNVERVVAHPNFRVFAAMNPATDVGKKDLPPGIRSRFTEIYVESPDSDTKSLRSIVEKYLGGETRDPAILRVSVDVTNLYLDIQRMAKSNMLVDGADQKAHFSLRTLTRTLSYAREIAPLCTLRRALYEGFHMSFLTFLGKSSEDLVAPLIKQHLFPQKASMKAELGRPLQQPTDDRSYVREGHYWLRQGLYPVEAQSHYIITPFVQRNLNNLIRASSTRRYPVLIQGPTSSGKTSMIEYLAKRSGNKFVRINNHEHTDLQEYLGSYISGTDGKLQFQEGVLVRALREGHWIVLDELNLAPTDVLEALNRLLDDNRELLIPETQEVVRPHEDFMLFATQNPAGLYGGRKVLSRAFRNRFLELHFDDIPVEELTEILQRRTMIPQSWCQRIVNVYKELSTLRQENRLFEQKSFATLRDLFRWAQRKADTVQDLATNGYMLLAERVRKEEERNAVKKVIETVMSKGGQRVYIDEAMMYAEDGSPEIQLYKDKIVNDGDVVWTQGMRRLFVLVAHAIRNNEPVLLVGETGCGKTTVCQMLADAFERQLHIVNAHQNTETGDLIGAQRPIRNRAGIEDLLHRQLLSALENSGNFTDLEHSDLALLLQTYDTLGQSARDAICSEHHSEIQANRNKAAALFEWADGSLVHAMKTAQFFLLDEISLADDSVLERLNSVLESSRTLLLAEKGPIDSFITASEGFQFLATMNPGGDYGKKELSPALRNRFTEIWVPALSDIEDVMQIVRSKLKPNVAQHAGCIVSFAQWFNDKYNNSVASSISIRDTLAWVTFINNSPTDNPSFGIVHGAAMVFIDTLGANPAGLLAISPASIDEERNACLYRLSKLLGEDVSPLYFDTTRVIATERSLQFGAFSIPKFSQAATEDSGFSLEAPTTRSNAMRIVRALQLSKPILLEGNPGVGKTTLITAIAKATGKPLTRLNLSEQTDLMDLFGSDVPVEGGQAGTFAWRDAPFLKAMKNGDWVLLDEMNLASQSVLEGLNAVLDHRGEVYISELDQTFQKHPDFRVFAAQNPHHQGGGRKGLPASFVNRFTVVYADVFRPEDLSLICAKVFPAIQETEAKKLIDFISILDEQVVSRRTFGTLGAPWEFNLRDTLRWLQLLALAGETGSARDYLDVVFVQRFRTEADRIRLLKLFETIYGSREPRISLYHNLGPEFFQVGLSTLPRNKINTRPDPISHLQIPQLEPMEALMISVEQSWPVILVGPPGSGKTVLLSQLASLLGTNLVNFSMNADVDAMDLVGGYEQVDSSREVHHFVRKLHKWLRRQISGCERPPVVMVNLLEYLETEPNPILESMHPSLQDIAQEQQNALTATPLSILLEELERLLQAPQQIEGARFQWVDGILIQALEQGNWLVLDNANLCSSAVLDRLNSLLEPNGYLSVNEHSTADGEARIVRPHPDFRIFLTMDPKFGELSRAMRNRAVEICLLSSENDEGHGNKMIRPPAYPLDSRLYRFRHFREDQGDFEGTFHVQYEHLSPADTDMLGSFNSAASKGLVTFERASVPAGQELSNDIKSAHDDLEAKAARFSQFLTSVWDAKITNLLHQIMGDSGRHVLKNPSSALSYHPLNNELALHLTATKEAQSVWYASMYDVLLDLHNMQHAMQNIPSVKFERRREKQKLPAFLNAYRRGIVKCADTIWEVSRSRQSDSPSLKSLRVLFWAFLDLASGPGFDRATFQTYLKMLNEEIMSFTEPLTILGTTLSKELTAFGPEVQLKTGLGMERIWRHFKPDTPKTPGQLSAILNLEGLADRLDDAMWKSNLGFDEMIQIRERFASSLQLVKTQDVDAAELIINLANAVQELEERIGEEDTSISPYFEDEFEGLCQFLDLTQSHSMHAPKYHTEIPNALRIVRAKSSLLARRSTKSAATEITYKPSQFFASLYLFLGTERETGREMVLKERFHIALLGKMKGVDEIQLTQLDRFESELLVLSQHISLDSDRITQDQYDALSGSYRSQVNELFASHYDIISSIRSDGISLHPATQISDLYRKALEKPFMRCMNVQIPTRGKPESQAWIDLALAGLSLYIPNYPFDPALRPMIERKLFNEQKSAFKQELEALRQFQLGFTGQDTSFRIRHTEEAIRLMGAEPPVPAIVRPEASELDALQGEFTNLLSVIQPLLHGTMTSQEASQDQTLQRNIAHIIKRLVGGYRNYDDITAPATGFLVCLNIGLTLGAQAQIEETSISTSLNYITQQTPFFGIHERYSRLDAEALIQFCEQELAKGHHAVDLRWHALHSLVIMKGIDSGTLSKSKVRGLIQNIFSSYYTEWKNKLLQDQEKEAKDKSLYTYRGDDEDDDEEDPELFPDYEKEDDGDDQSATASSSSTSRDQAIQLANMHAGILLEAGDPSDSLETLLEWSSAQMVRVAEGEAHRTKHESALPAIILALGKKSDALASSGTGKTYNFYFDANIPEAKRLINLVHQIQHRYRQIRKVWPEHATLSDVLRTCEEALAFRHVDPVAKFITKSEKLHGYIYEWQRVASKEFSTANLYDDLTKLLVSWRQLELTTWARLFDIEMEKCRDDAKSWFFIAYETIVAASESSQDDKSMDLHAKELLKTLETFFSTTTLGQFHQRIKLLQQFREHIAIRIKDAESLSPIHLALDNFIAYFSRLEKPVREALTKGRQALEQKVNEVIKLASWKDTNIEALKQSAKTSHRKLSKLVRKFRTLLKQPVSGIYKAGFPDESVVIGDVRIELVGTSVNPTALEICDMSLPGWAERPSRFKNLAATVSIMQKKTTPNMENVDGSAYIESFIKDLEITMAELQKATPTTLTEENKENVQHLKTQKRKLYADTLKALRQMGFRPNLSNDILDKQEELSTVLATLRPMSGESTNLTRGAELFLHKTLSIMTQVRYIHKEHSGDLTGNDVARSIGFLEGILYSAIRQRGLLSKATLALNKLQLPTAQIANLCSSSLDAITSVSDDQVTGSGTIHTSISWLSAILKTGANITAAQAKLGKTNEFDVVVQGLRDWSSQFQNLADAFGRLPTLPSNVWSDAHKTLNESIRQQLSEFRLIFSTWMNEYPLPRAVLKQIQPYVLDDSAVQVVSFSEIPRIDVDAQSKAIFEALDLILGSIQDVEIALKEIPSSIEDSTWFLKEEQALSAAITALYTPQVTHAVHAIVDKIHRLYEDDNLRAISALFATIQPILNQYIASHSFLVSKFSALHLSTTKLLHRLSKSFLQIGTQGFCQPSEKSADQKGKDDKLESGTGLGEGEGAEDISKDIEDDEDLEDLAQEKKGEREGSIEEEEDAVDMGEQEMEGDMGDVAENEDQDGSGDEGDEDAQSETGSVDDLGPSAVDEKMWDDGGKEEEDTKDKEGTKDVGTEKDEQVAAEEKEKEKEKKGDDSDDKKEEGTEEEEMDMEGEDQEENVGAGETEKMDPHAKEEETLDLPEELNIDGMDDEKEDEIGDMDMGEEEEDDIDAEAGAEPDTVDDNVGSEQEGDEENDTTRHVPDDDKMDEDQGQDQDEEDEEDEGEEPMDDDKIPLPDEQTPDENRQADDENRADTNAEAGAGTDANEEAHQDQKEQTSASAANREDGNQGETSGEQQESTAEDGALGHTAQPDASGAGEDAEESPETQSFKKIGDTLERWYNQQRQISDAKKKDETQVQQIDKEVDMANAEFEHLPDEETQADTQALGTATEEQAKTLDHDMAMAVDEEEKVPALPVDEDDEMQGNNHDVEMEDAAPEQDQDQEQLQNSTDGRPQAFIGEQKTLTSQQEADQEMADAGPLDEDMSDTSSVEDVELKLESTHLDPDNPISPETARALWLSHETSTHSLSQQLTEHLRLILAPTLATKLRGDFRTGKRLNLKRIIPYIASGYKRDKIWLRRSQPSKRSYQVMIALDDSHSMADSGASSLALKTLTLVSRALAMLEVGEVSIVGFGDTVTVAHDFDKPFTSEAGARVFSQFGFQATKTNVRGLVEKSLGLFEEARRRQGGKGEELWQLMLVVSDGICDGHEEVRRLVRRAREERVMIVFVIVDSSATPQPAQQPGVSSTTPTATTDNNSPAGNPENLPEAATTIPPPRQEPQKTSILDLQSVEIIDGKVVRWKYMDRFPFGYYLVVRDVRELPNVLAGALRQWFGEVVGSG